MKGSIDAQLAAAAILNSIDCISELLNFYVREWHTGCSNTTYSIFYAKIFQRVEGWVKMIYYDMLLKRIVTLP